MSLLFVMLSLQVMYQNGLEYYQKYIGVIIFQIFQAQVEKDQALIVLHYDECCDNPFGIGIFLANDFLFYKTE